MSVYEIAHKIRCEAREVVDREAYENPIQKAAFDQLDAAEAGLKRLRESEKKRFSGRLAELNVERDQLAAQERLIAAKLDELVNRLQRWTKLVDDKDPKVQEGRKQAQDDFTELPQWLASREKNESDIRSFNSRLSLLERDRIYALQNIAQAQAAVQKRFAEQRKFLENTFAYALRFEIEEINDARIDTATFTRAITLGTVAIGIAGGERKKRKAKREVRVAATFKELLALNKECGEGQYFMDDDGLHTLQYPIRGHIGLDEVITQYLAVLNGKLGLSETASSGKTYSSIITFTTTIDGTIKPSTSLTRPSGDKLTGNTSILASRDDLHEATIVIVPPKPPGAAEPDKTVNVRILSSNSLLRD